ncbi:MAG: SCO family protein [Erythrobacter sp.]
MAAILMWGAAACSQEAPLNPGEPPLAGASIGGDVALVDEEGKDVSFNDYAGKYRMVYFGYAYCPDICPYDVQRMAKGYEDFKAANPELSDKVIPMFISVDPQRDTAEVVAEFTAAFSSDMIGFTGTEKQIADAAKAFGVFYSKGAVDEDNPEAYLMDHSRAAFLMGPDGKPIALLPVEESAAGVTKALETWVS